VTIAPANSPHTITTYYPRAEDWPDNPTGAVQKTVETIGIAMNVRVVLLGEWPNCTLARVDNPSWGGARSKVLDDRSFCDGLKRQVPARYVNERYDTVSSEPSREPARVQPAFEKGQWVLKVLLPQPRFTSESRTISRQLPFCPSHKDEVREETSKGNGDLLLYEGEFTVAMQSIDPHQTRFKASDTVNGYLHNGIRYDVSWDLERRDFVCGPDVTEQTRQTLASVKAFFHVLPNVAKVMQCERLQLPHGLTAWDISRFYWKNTGWLDNYTRNNTCCLPGDGKTDDSEPSDSCKHTVRHSGKCVLAGTLNYFLYGQMYRLCHDYARYAQCTRDLGACPLAGTLMPGEFERYEAQCRAETGFEGRPVFQAELCAPDRVLVPVQWDRTALSRSIFYYKTLFVMWGDIGEPIAFAEAAFDNGPDATPPIENRAQCHLECEEPRLESIPYIYKWLPLAEGY